jgi:transcriptional regulator with XRE-family HTH domain
MGKRNKVTTRDIAEYTGVSQSTVSMILSNKPHVSFSKETIDKVRQGAKELGYKKPVAGVKKKEQALAKSIIVICPLLSNGYYDHSFDHRTCQRLWLYRIYCQYIEGRLSRRTLFKPFIWV